MPCAPKVERSRTESVSTRSFSSRWSDKRAPLSEPPWAASITTPKRGDVLRTEGWAGGGAGGGGGGGVVCAPASSGATTQPIARQQSPSIQRIDGKAAH